tara:strand:+ start:269 stop:1006 length:738 start_codon:yes stop_codon:yes gene_type:complete
MSIKIKKLLELPQHEQRSPEWFDQRKDKLTSSDAATALDINPYQKKYELLFKKCGLDLKPFVGNIATRHGQKYEDEAINKYCDIMGMKNYNFGLLCHKDIHENDEYPWLAGSPDGIVEEIRGLSSPILLEVKCPFRRKIIPGKIPDYYYPQVQLNLFITQLEYADFIEYRPPAEMNIVRIKIDNIWLKNNLPILESFWKEVEYYRKHGIETHPMYQKKKKTIEITVPDPEIPDETPSIDGYAFRD